MARFSAVLLVVSLLLAGRLAHAAPPSTAEVFWRSVLPGSDVPDAVLRFLRPDNHLISKATAEDAGRPNVPFNYQNYKRPSAMPAGGHSAVGARGERAGELMNPFRYKYGGAGNRPVAAGGSAPFSYDYKAPSKGVAFGGGARHDDTPFSYDYKAALSKGVPIGGGARDDDRPFRNYGYEAPGEHHHVGGGAARTTTTTTTVFFHEGAVRVGERLQFHFPAAAPAALGLLPRRVADSIPFATAALPGVLALFGVSPGSAKAAAMAETLRTCELPPLAGEAKFCAASLEALVERAIAALGTRDVRAVTSALPRAGAPLQTYTVRAVRRVDGASFVACHDEVYPYTVYRCHGTGPARAYMVEMEGARGGAVTVATVCHTDTSLWNPDHVSFKLLGTKPGGTPVCHLMPYGHIIWAKNVKVSTA